jgi:hypothetical protein
MNQPDYSDFFSRYAAAYRRSLSGTVEIDTILGFFAETVLALGINGSLSAAERDGLAERLEEMYAFYKTMGTRGLAVERIETEPLYTNHDRVRVFYRGEYEKRDGSRLTIPFDIAYLLQRRTDGPRIFAFIAGDESALYRQHGLIDADGKPA